MGLGPGAVAGPAGVAKLGQPDWAAEVVVGPGEQVDEGIRVGRIIEVHRGVITTVAEGIDPGDKLRKPRAERVGGGRGDQRDIAGLEAGPAPDGLLYQDVTLFFVFGLVEAEEGNGFAVRLKIAVQSVERKARAVAMVPAGTAAPEHGVVGESGVEVGEGVAALAVPSVAPTGVEAVVEVLMKREAGSGGVAGADDAIRGGDAFFGVGASEGCGPLLERVCW